MHIYNCMHTHTHTHTHAHTRTHTHIQSTGEYFYLTNSRTDTIMRLHCVCIACMLGALAAEGVCRQQTSCNTLQHTATVEWA